ncbi:hypothetical protein NPIL_475951 [Nephila pilipes]|uniref:Uncharacterized protein n=1 Tax=Nephila pilipes TaxID=299642 RepID=A0A8X6TDS1_NEPPI|nr:hypothetical protein NPIL_475951 [Nephila pilipes]
MKTFLFVIIPMEELPLRGSDANKMFKESALRNPAKFLLRNILHMKQTFSESSLTALPEFSERVENISNDASENEYDFTAKRKKENL